MTVTTDFYSRFFFSPKTLESGRAEFPVCDVDISNSESEFIAYESGKRTHLSQQVPNIKHCERHSFLISSFVTKS